MHGMRMDPALALRTLGLSEGETKVYIALLRKGPCRANDIKRATQLHRTTLYDFLDGLARKGLASHVQKHGARVFTAADPKRLLGIVAEKQEMVQGALPALSGLAERHAGGRSEERRVGKECRSRWS